MYLLYLYDTICMVNKRFQNLWSPTLVNMMLILRHRRMESDLKVSKCLSVYYSVTAHVVDINQTVRPCASDHAPDLTGP